MARLPLIDPDKTTGDIRASFDRMPVKLNIFRMMAHAEANMIPAMRFANSILHKQKLSPRSTANFSSSRSPSSKAAPMSGASMCRSRSASASRRRQIDALERGDYR